MYQCFNRLLVLATLFTFLSATLVGEAQQPNQTAQSIDVSSKLNYLLFLPDGYKQSGSEKSWPLLVFLHGAGERGDNLEEVKKWGPPKLVADKPDFPFIVVSPQCPKGIYWNLDHVNQLVDNVIAKHTVDKDRVYLTGLSMGGYGTWGLASLHPGKFAAIAPICGGGDPESSQQLIDLPIWAFHGDADNVVPLKGSKEIVDAIKANGGKKVKLTIYEGVEHNSWTQTYANQELYDWLLSHRRK